VKPELRQHERLDTPLKKASKMKLGEQPECAADVRSLCGKLAGSHNFAVIDCLQNDNLVSIFDPRGSDVNKDWTHKDQDKDKDQSHKDKDKD